MFFRCLSVKMLWKTFIDSAVWWMGDFSPSLHLAQAQPIRPPLTPVPPPFLLDRCKGESLRHMSTLTQLSVSFYSSIAMETPDLRLLYLTFLFSALVFHFFKLSSVGMTAVHIFQKYTEVTLNTRLWGKEDSQP